MLDDSSKTETTNRPKLRIVPIGKLALIIVLFTMARLSYDFFAPFFWIESALLLVLLTSPFVIAAYRLYGIVDISSPYSVFAALPEDNDREKDYISPKLIPYISPFFQLCSLLFISFVLTGSVFTLNRLVDNSPSESTTFTIVDTVHEEKKGADTYYVRIPRPDFMNLPFYFQTTEKIKISHSDFTRIAPWHTQIVLSVHRGALGMPWYERDYVLENLLAQEVIPKRPAEVR